MNRLVIIGNGFDLAHGLPTSYKHFIDDFWKNFKDKCKNDEYSKLITAHDLYNGYYNGYKPIENFNDFKVNLKTYSKENGHYFDLTNFVCKCQSDVIFKFNNDFFRFICDNSIENWVDIENEYYKKLKIIVKLASLTNNEKKYQTIILNKEFEQVKSLLEKYLNKIEKIQKTNDSILKLFELTKINEEKYFSEFSKNDRRELEDFQNKYNLEREEGKDITTYCLNFNYTQTIDDYIDVTFQKGEYRNYGKFKNLQIHGKLNDKNNKINFGFGDEMDDDYKLIENVDDNEYLKNFKSFGYSQNSNYRKLLDFIDDNKFQVFIMGHSCGLSDRTLLNTIFEHNYCRSIKVFYYEEKDKDGNVIKDNYTEIIQNISRHFNKKALMREKIVNKTLCQPLPQIKLHLK